MTTTNLENIDQASDPQLSSKAALPDSFCIGDWQVTPELNRIRLLSDNEERQLEPRLIKLLCFLAANAHRVISRQELVQELWPRVIVNENSLTRAVSELRKQLQASDSSVANYIETIPKRGYRLIPPVESFEQLSPASKASHRFSWPAFFTVAPLRSGLALTAACICLIAASWVSLDGMPLLESEAEPVFLSDEVLDEERDYLGGKLQLSTMEGSSPVVEAIATPVVSLDEKQYAFIQYDTSGSTIFLGGLGTAVEPVPVYYSQRHLFNLAWSPVGNSLLFAMQPSMTTTAVYSSVSETADLVMLNLNTLETSRLVEDMSPAENNANKGLNLT